MRKILLPCIVFIILSAACQPSQKMIEEAIQKTEVARPTGTVIPATATPNPTATITITPTQVDSYCDYERAKEVIEIIDQWQVGSDDDGQTATPSLLENFNITDEQRELIVSGLTEKVAEMDAMDVPDCLVLSIGYLKESYMKLRDLFSPAENAEVENAFSLMMEIGIIQNLFDEEYQRVKNCVDSGCKK